jgi:hypothetical protein
VNWLLENKFNARPIVAVEDHVYHISELLRTVSELDSSLLASLTIVCLDRAGPDTDAALDEWLTAYPELQIASRVADKLNFQSYTQRLAFHSDSVFKNQNDYCRALAAMIRPQGVLLQDIELETLEFVPRDRWWESTMLASTVRGIVGGRPPRCAFISNKRGYEATFGAELLAAGHDPRDVLNKYEIEPVVVPFLKKYLDQHFPQSIHWLVDNQEQANDCRVSCCAEERQALAQRLGIVIWPPRDQCVEVSGTAFDANKKLPVNLPMDSNEIQTWRELIEARLENRMGVEVQSVGARVAPAGALRAETTNAAARHIHALRKRLHDSQDIVTVAGHYRLRDGLSVGLVKNAV